MEWNHFLSKLLSISKIGLKFSKDPYALENYQELQDLVLLQANEVNQPIDVVKLYPKDTYPTPNVSVRIMIFNEKNELLMVQEKTDGGYAVPGGWCDVFESARQNAIKETKQETGLDVEIVRLLAVMQRELYKPKPTMISEYVFYFLAEVKGGTLAYNHELLDIGYFDYNALPVLSFKTSKRELDIAMDVLKHHKEVYFD
ncbi:MAG TPA: NUDIX hydrolase N-terminal domain-containing protein [Erysipelotrichaceae bacterium]|jgi:8-oxo-dGTP diphosphatase|nr:NUDIX hydrolase N-terminal domain-containing protein [Erysipelotrichaceae bacterium]